MIGLVHLVWAPLGPGPLRRFLDSCRMHPPGTEHELVVVLNGAPGPGERASLLAELADTEHRLIEPGESLLDLPAYGLAAERLEYERLCFVNSYATAQSAGWLALLERALQEPEVAIAAASGSWESQAQWIRGPLRHWPYQLVRAPRMRRDYPSFPNPHVRTGAFALSRADALALGLGRARSKHETYLMESGRNSITARILRAGRRVVVVGRDGRLYDPPEWPASATYRAGGQRNLLIADNRTEDWLRASPRLRRRLSRDAWGRPDP